VQSERPANIIRGVASPEIAGTNAGHVAKLPGFAVIDVETSGLDASADRVVELAVVRVDERGNTLDEWTTLVNPGVAKVGPSRVHGITAASVRAAPTFAEIIGELNHRLTGRALVAHRAMFDLDFLTNEYLRLGWTFPPDVPHLCTFKASAIYQPRLRRRGLRDCCRAAGFSMGRGHSALGDARATAWLLGGYLARAEPMHHRLPAEALLVEWPRIPLSAMRPLPRERRGGEQGGSPRQHGPSGAHRQRA
jgi:DNA polymerase-3 subunit epsilon